MKDCSYKNTLLKHLDVKIQMLQAERIEKMKNTQGREKTMQNKLFFERIQELLTLRKTVFFDRLDQLPEVS